MMTKKEAIGLFDGERHKLESAVGVTKAAVSQWPNPLPERISDRVLGAAVRAGRTQQVLCLLKSKACNSRGDLRDKKDAA